MYVSNPDHYTDHTFIPFYWQSYVTEACSYFSETTIENYEKHKVALIKHKGSIVGLSPVFDYIYRSAELQIIQNVTLYDWISQSKRIKIPKASSKNKQEIRDIESLEDYLSDVSSQSDFSESNSLDENFENPS